jgi:hypothetical protein
MNSATPRPNFSRVWSVPFFQGLTILAAIGVRGVMRFNLLGFCFLPLALLSSSGVRAAEPPSSDTSTEISVSHLSVFGLTLGKNTLADVRAQLGDAPVIDYGETGLSVKQVCYITRNGDHTRLVFESGAGGGWTQITGFRLIAERGKSAKSDQCRADRRIGHELRTAGGLGLGLSRTQVIRLLGLPTKTRGNTLIYESLTTEQILNKTFDIRTVIKLDFDGMKVSVVNVFRTETN